jgi:RND superfamily putative drug exporter
VAKASATVRWAVWVGQRLDWPRRRLRKETASGRAWTAWARGVVRARWAAVAAAVAVLAVLGGFAPSLRTGTTSADALADAGPAHEGLAMLTRMRETYDRASWSNSR